MAVVGSIVLLHNMVNSSEWSVIVVIINLINLINTTLVS